MTTEPHLLRSMMPADVDQVLQIDQLSFPVSWSKVTFLHEMNENPNAYMGVVLKSEPVPEDNSGLGIIRRLLHPKSIDTVVAYAGMWIHGREAHISTIASHPQFRRQGFGELMLLGMIGRGICLGADHVVLEVRIGNLTAQNLYRKYEFSAIGFYPRYYHDNNEDALYMVARPLDEAYQTRLRGRATLLAAQTPFTDEFSGLHLEQALTTSSKE
ncbi:MAG: GNAT family N-acetyltransferase [Chloroflexi bacterium]|nr:GNAT family N-acetyltransferase [Chloroflexota bacterium]